MAEWFHSAMTAAGNDKRE